MKIDINKPELNVEVGDVFKHRENYYLICKEQNFITNKSKYFILNLTNGWTSSGYYNDIETLIRGFDYDYLIKGKNLVLKLRED